MKTTAIILISIFLTACATTTAPDGTVTKSVDPIAYQAAYLALSEWQRQHPVTGDK